METGYIRTKGRLMDDNSSLRTNSRDVSVFSLTCFVISNIPVDFTFYLNIILRYV